MPNKNNSFNAEQFIAQSGFLAANPTFQLANLPAGLLTAFSMLSKRELQILRLIASGFTTRQIAEQLFTSAHTVNNQRAQISQKLGLQGAFSLLQFAQRHHQWLQ